MLRLKIKELIARKEFAEGRRVMISEIAESAGIHRVTLSRMINRRGFSTKTDYLDRLCAFFGCRIEDLVEYVPDDQLPTPRKLGDVRAQRD